MKKKTETTLSVLKEIRNILEQQHKVEISGSPFALGTGTGISASTHNSVEVDFPELTAKQIISSCDNKLLYSTEWYKNEPFFTTETTRKGKRIINTELKHKGSTWNECNRLGEMLNFAECIYLLKENEGFRRMLTGWNHTWTCSMSSDGRLVHLGSFGSGGVHVGYGLPGYSHSRLGVCFSRSGLNDS